MKSALVCSAALAGASAWSDADRFEDFVKKHGRDYRSLQERDRRFKIFRENMEFIEETNAKGLSYTVGVTAFADMTFEEFRAEYIGGFRNMPAENNNTKFEAPAGFVEEDSVDWVAKGAVTSVKNQGTCGSCWAFSTVGALEGAMHVSGRSMVNLSMQHLLNCDHVDQACSGGLMDHAFAFVEQNGIPALTDEPYLCKDGCRSADLKCGTCEKNTGVHCFFSDCPLGECKGITHNCQCPSGQCFTGGTCGPEQPQPLVLKPGDVTKHTDVGRTDSALEAALGQQPVSIAVKADHRVFPLYTGGLITDDECGPQLDHGVLAVGYGTDKGQKYWKVKNSWGADWGENGYFRIARSASGGGECGARLGASFPSVKAADSIVV